MGLNILLTNVLLNIELASSREIEYWVRFLHLKPHITRFLAHHLLFVLYQARVKSPAHISLALKSKCCQIIKVGH